MASVLDICNLALSRLGDDATVSSIDPPEGSLQAEHCARFYPLARDTVLSMHEWGFATRPGAPARLVNFQYGGWAHTYALPADCIKVARVFNDAEKSAHFALGADGSGSAVLLTNIEQARMLYVMRIEDPARFPPLFVDAVVWLLTSHLAGPLVKGETGANLAQQTYQAFLGALQRAAGADLQQHRPAPEDYQAPWIEGR